jgi:CheY-like chemotaxis protein
LIVDDVAPTRRSIENKLTVFGYESVSVDGVDAALARLADDTNFDVVIADELMPKRGGLDLLAAMRADPRLDKVKFVLMCLFAGDEPDVQGPYRPDAVALKPVRGKAFGRLIDGVITGKAPRAPVIPAPTAAAEAGTCVTGIYRTLSAPSDSMLVAAADTRLQSALLAFPGRRILLVEDNPVNQRVAKRVLQKLPRRSNASTPRTSLPCSWIARCRSWTGSPRAGGSVRPKSSAATACGCRSSH